MAITSTTFSDKPQLDGTSLPISQIAIELYSPVPGGLTLGGRFAPESLELGRCRFDDRHDSKGRSFRATGRIFSGDTPNAWLAARIIAN